jgi:hypothetical protein
VSIELRGQGKELPSGFGYRGQWILESRIFLFVPGEAQSGDPTAPQFTRFINYGRDDWIVGFDATQLAAAIRITIQELFEANRAQRLTLEQAETGTTGEGAPAKRYTFCVGDKEGSLTIASPTHFGST